MGQNGTFSPCAKFERCCASRGAGAVIEGKIVPRAPFLLEVLHEPTYPRLNG
jgi:hypothetical protein